MWISACMENNGQLYIYIYIYRERERERDRCIHTNTCMYIYDA